MTRKPSVLVVAPTASVASIVFAWVTDAGYSPTIVTSFSAAKQYLEDRPSLLISEVRLGEYNGLHLALRAQARRIPTVIVGHPDAVLEREAAQLDAVYLTPPFDAQELLSSIQPIPAAPELPRHDRPVDTASVSFISVRERSRSSRTVPISS